MKVKRSLAVMLLACSAPALAQVNALPPTRHILVYGDAQARAIPDRFKIGIDFESIDLDTDLARQRVESNVQSILKLLAESNVAESEIVLTSLQVGTYERYDSRKEEQVFGGTKVTRTLSARFSAQTDLKKFLANVKTSKELTISKVETELSDEIELRKALRGKAIESSKAKAEVIARAYGVKLTGLYSVSDVAPQFQYGIQQGSWPSQYEWNHRRQEGGAYAPATLDSVTVTGTRANNAESFQTGYVDFQDKIYAVFLVAD